LKKLENRIEYEYCGVLKEHLRDFVKMKRAVGYKYNSETALLKRLFCNSPFLFVSYNYIRPVRQLQKGRKCGIL
jgi:hypothetical protein